MVTVSIHTTAPVMLTELLTKRSPDQPQLHALHLHSVRFNIPSRIPQYEDNLKLVSVSFLISGVFDK